MRNRGLLALMVAIMQATRVDDQGFGEQDAIDDDMAAARKIIKAVEEESVE